MINIRTKGQSGEREVAILLNGILIITMRELGYPEDLIIKCASSVQRNQNQSAVGGGDLTNTFGLCIEVKRQEILNVETWWKQCVASAKRNNELPVLLYRQNNKSWRCITYLKTIHPNLDEHGTYVRADISYIDFQTWYKSWITVKIKQGEEIRT